MWSLEVVIYELSTSLKPNFLQQCRPKDVFIEEWSPGLNNIKDNIIVKLFKQLLVLNPNDRCTAKELTSIFKKESDIDDISQLLSCISMKLECSQLKGLA